MKNYFLIKLHGDLCLAACLNESWNLIGKHFFRYFKKNLGTHIFSFWIVYPMFL